MTSFPESASPLESKNAYSRLKCLITRTSYMQYAVLLIVGISFLLRLLWIGNNSLLVEEAYYWNYAQHLDFSYLDHPPMVAILIKLTTSIFGTNEFGVRIASIFCWLLASFFSFKLTNLNRFSFIKCA